MDFTAVIIVVDYYNIKSIFAFFKFNRMAKALLQILITVVNNDEQEAVVTVPLPVHAAQASDLLSGSVIPVMDNKITLSLKPCDGTLLKVNLG